MILALATQASALENLRAHLVAAKAADSSLLAKIDAVKSAQQGSEDQSHLYVNEDERIWYQNQAKYNSEQYKSNSWEYQPNRGGSYTNDNECKESMGANHYCISGTCIG